MRAKTVNEVFGQKDLVRMQDIQTKSAGDSEKEKSLALTQAKLITNAAKAKARAEAAEEVFGPGSEISQIFYDRAKELGGSYVRSEASKGTLAPVVKPAEKGEKLKRKFETKFFLPSEKVRMPQQDKVGKPGFSRGLDPKASLGIGRFHDAPEVGGKFQGNSYLLPLGTVNLMTGESKWFNVLETWDEDSTAEVWKTSAGKYKLLFTSSNKPSEKLQDRVIFLHSQTNQKMFEGVLVDYVHLKNLSELIRVYGGSLFGYTYK